MAVVWPFDYPEKYGRQTKITKAEETVIWETIRDNLNNLIARCNGRNITSIAAISIVTPITTPVDPATGTNIPISASQYDANIATVENAMNALIFGSINQGLNNSNTVSLYKRDIASGGEPLLAFHRDTNFSTIQIFLNTLHTIYTWEGF